MAPGLLGRDSISHPAATGLNSINTKIDFTPVPDAPITGSSEGTVISPEPTALSCWAAGPTHQQQSGTTESGCQPKIFQLSAVSGFQQVHRETRTGFSGLENSTRPSWNSNSLGQAGHSGSRGGQGLAAEATNTCASFDPPREQWISVKVSVEGGDSAVCTVDGVVISTTSITDTAAWVNVLSNVRVGHGTVNNSASYYGRFKAKNFKITDGNGVVILHWPLAGRAVDVSGNGANGIRLSAALPSHTGTDFPAITVPTDYTKGDDDSGNLDVTVSKPRDFEFNIFQG